MLTDCGWRDALKAQALSTPAVLLGEGAAACSLTSLPAAHFASRHGCATGILNEPGNERMTVEELVARLTPEARATVPADVKATLLGEINEFIRQNA